MRGAAGVQYGSHINNSLQSSIFSQTKNGTKSMWEMLCRERDLQRKRRKYEK
jgi:hypothetical protein